MLVLNWRVQFISHWAEIDSTPVHRPRTGPNVLIRVRIQGFSSAGTPGGWGPMPLGRGAARAPLSRGRQPRRRARRAPLGPASGLGGTERRARTTLSGPGTPRAFRRGKRLKQGGR